MDVVAWTGLTVYLYIYILHIKKTYYILYKQAKQSICNCKWIESNTPYL